jgi:VanZ family protein
MRKIKEKQNKSVTLCLILIVATLIFIWSNSIDSQEKSHEKSLIVMQAIEPLLEVFVGRGNVTHHLVRKLAHFTEFGLLGAELAAFMYILRRRDLQATVNCLFTGLAAAVVDETIQIYTQRGAQVSDVLLDFAGSAAGVFLVILIHAVARKRGRREKKN